MIRIHKIKAGYFYYCRQCKRDHFFQYGTEIKTSNCGERHKGIMAEQKEKFLNNIIVIGCVWEFNKNSVKTDCMGFCSFTESEIEMAMSFKFCPYCGDRIYHNLKED